MLGIYLGSESCGKTQVANQKNCQGYIVSGENVAIWNDAGIFFTVSALVFNALGGLFHSEQTHGAKMYFLSVPYKKLK